MNKIVFIVSFVLFSFIISSQARADSPLNSCGTINIAGTYSLTQSFGGGGSCIIINTNNVIIDGLGQYAITGDISGDSANAGDPAYGFTLNNIVVTGNVSSNGTCCDVNSNGVSGGTITISSSTINGIVTSVSGYSSGFGGIGGDITIENSTTTSISSEGGGSESNDGGRGGSITINSSKSTSVTSRGGNANYNAGNGGHILIASSTISDVIISIGGTAAGSCGSGGAITIINSTTTAIQTLGSGLSGYGAGGNGGTVSILRSIIGSVTSNGGSSEISGFGGAINLINSTASGQLSSRGGDGNSSTVGGNGGTFEITNSTTTSIDSSGGNGSTGGNAGLINVTNSFVTSLNADGNNTYGDNGGSGALITLVNSIATTISSNGGDGIYQPGNGGSVNITSSNFGSISVIGGVSYSNNGGIGGSVTASSSSNLNMYTKTINLSGGIGDTAGGYSNGTSGVLTMIYPGNISTNSSTIFNNISMLIVNGTQLGSWNGVFNPLPISFSTSTASNLSSTTATLNSSILNDGEISSYTVRGFYYGSTSSYGSTTIENGTFGVGDFVASISNLVCGTTYHFAAYAKNLFGTSTAADNTFVTSSCPVVETPVQTITGGGGSSYSSSGGSRSYIIPVSSLTTPTPINVVNPSKIITKQLFLGSTGVDVTVLQTILKSLGLLDVSPTGYFGVLTEKAVRDYQKSKGIMQTGTIGPLTLKSINSIISIATLPIQTNKIIDDLYVGIRGSEVYVLQVTLKKLGFFNTVPTGYFGNLTLQAVKAYQTKHNINPTGYVGPLTRKALGGEGR